MASRISDHLRSNVYGLIAVFIALSGTAYAVDGPLIGQNQVGSDDIIPGEVKESDLGSNAVKSGKVADNSLTAADIGPGAISSAELQSDSVGSTQIKTNAVGYLEFDGHGAFNTEITDTGAGNYGIADNSIQSSELSTDSVGYEEVQAATFNPGDIASENARFGIVQNAIDTDEISNAAVNGADVADNSLGGADINEALLTPTASVFAAPAGPGTIQIPNDGTTTVSSKQVPAGKYLVSGSARIGNYEDEQSFAGCSLTKDGVRIAGDFWNNGSPAGFGQLLREIGDDSQYSFEVAISNASPATLGIFCGEDGDGVVKVEWSTLTALEVESIG